MIIVSVIIPCYNQGAYIEETVSSVLTQTYQDFEIIIVDDGSTDLETIKLLSAFNRPKTKIISINNQGVATARNIGIKEAQGKYILPLDSDDTIEPSYLEKSVAILESNSDISIVYCEGRLFGAEKRPIMAADFSVGKMLISNLIFASALFRKESWQSAGGYKSNMRYGCEDWDFWLSIIEQNSNVHKIPEILFNYRIKETSRNTSMSLEMQVEMHLQLMKNHPELFIERIRPLLRLYYKISNSKPYSLLKRIKSFFRFQQ